MKWYSWRDLDINDVIKTWINNFLCLLQFRNWKQDPCWREGCPEEPQHHWWRHCFQGILRVHRTRRFHVQGRLHRRRKRFPSHREEIRNPILRQVDIRKSQLNENSHNHPLNQYFDISRRCCIFHCNLIHLPTDFNLFNDHLHLVQDQNIVHEYDIWI